MQEMIINYTPMSEQRLSDFRVISTTDALWTEMVIAQLWKQTAGAVELTDLLHITTNLNDLYTLLLEGNITFTSPDAAQDAAVESKDNTDMNTVTLKRLSQNQVTLLNSADNITVVSASGKQMEIEVEGALDTLKQLAQDQENVKVRRVLQQLIKKVATATGVELEVKTRSRLPNSLPANVVKVKTSKTQQRILAYVNKHFLSTLVRHYGGTYTAIDSGKRDAAVNYLRDLSDHKLSGRSCASLIRKLNELEVIPAPCPIDTFVPPQLETTKKAEVEWEFPPMAVNREVAAPVEEQEIAPVEEQEIAPVETKVDDTDWYALLGGTSPSSDMDEPTAADLALIELEELSDAEIDAKMEADLQLRELKMKNRNPLSPMHAATSVDEYWEIAERVQRESEIANAEGIEFVSLDELAAEEEGEEVSADGNSGVEVEQRQADDDIVLPLTRDYWATAWGACWDALKDVGVELVTGDEDKVHLTRDQAEMVAPRLHQIASGSQAARFGGEIDWDFDDEVDDELAAWDEACIY
jgi:hypothetical protein